MAKVAKVSAFMYGQDDIQILDRDALKDIDDLKLESFDVLVANPPFAVEGFLRTLDESIQEKYTLTQTTGLNSNTNSIQCFFIERAKQVLKADGVAGIIVPSSVLSNSDKTHIGTREIILKYFDIVSLVELGGGTFGKTGTNTIVLFLRRKSQQPEPAEHYYNRTTAYFNGIAATDDTLIVHEDLYLVKKYCEHIEIPFEEYSHLLNVNTEGFATLSGLMEYDVFKDYYADFDKSTPVKKLKEGHRKQINDLSKKIESEFTKKYKKAKQKFTKEELSAAVKKNLPKRKSQLIDVQKEELEQKFIDYLVKVEKDKLYYFILAYTNPQKVLIVKSPTKNAEQKKFLGYEWSGSKGNEGIKYHGGETVHDIITPMFDPNNIDNFEKINYSIQQNFLGKYITELPEGCSYANVTDILDFSRKDFNKTFSLTSKKSIVIDTKWALFKLENLMTIVRGASPRPIRDYITENKNGISWIKIGDVEEGSKYITKTKEKITPEGSNKSRYVKIGDFILSNSMSFGRPYILKINGCIHDGWLLMTNINEDINKDYLYEILSYKTTQLQFTQSAGGGVVQNLNSERVRAVKIPLPPLNIQQKIVEECEVIDKAVVTAENKMKNGRLNIKKLFYKIQEKGIAKRLGDICTLKAGQFVKAKDILNSTTESLYPCYGGNGLRGYTKTYTHEGRFPLVGRQGALCGNVHFVEGLFHATEHALVATPIIDLNIDWLYYLLKSMNLNQYATGTAQPGLSVKNLTPLSIKLPSLKEQQKMVIEIIALENKIKVAEIVVGRAAKLKQAVMDKYL